MAEAEDLKSSQCGFDPHSGHQLAQSNHFAPRLCLGSLRNGKWRPWRQSEITSHSFFYWYLVFGLGHYSTPTI